MRRLLAALLGVVIASGCVSGGDAEDSVTTTAAPAPQTLLVIGSETSADGGLSDPLREAWPRVLFTEAFPLSTTLVNAASGPSTVADAIAEQVPLAAEVRPDVVAVWLGSYDLLQGTPPEALGARMRDLLDAVTGDGTRVLVADLPRLPAYDDDLRQSYNEQIAAAAQAVGATLVPLGDRALEPVDAEHAYQPDAAGHRIIAGAFADALAATS